jgi:hypothetical protein
VPETPERKGPAAIFDRWSGPGFLAIALVFVLVLYAVFGRAAIRFHSDYWFWELSANLTMIIYFWAFDLVHLKKGGVFDGVSLDEQRKIRCVRFLALAFLFISVVSGGMSYVTGYTFMVFSQLAFLLLFSAGIWRTDSLIMTFVKTQSYKSQFRLFVHLVDIPMFMSFTVIFVATSLKSFVFGLAPDLNIFADGSVAFQVVSFNVMFWALNRLPITLAGTTV